MNKPGLAAVGIMLFLGVGLPACTSNTAAPTPSFVLNDASTLDGLKLAVSADAPELHLGEELHILGTSAAPSAAASAKASVAPSAAASVKASVTPSAAASVKASASPSPKTSPSPSPSPTPTPTPTPTPSAVIPTLSPSVPPPAVNLKALDTDLVTLQSAAITSLTTSQNIVIRLYTGTPTADQTTFKQAIAADITSYTAAVQVVRLNVAKMKTYSYANIIAVLAQAKTDMYNAHVNAVETFNESVLVFGQAYKSAHTKS